MAVTAFMYAEGVVNAYDGNIDFSSSTIKVALLDSNYTPDQDTHATWAAISGDEVAGAGYTAGGDTLTSKTNANTANVIKLDAADVTWSASTITAAYAVIYDSVSGYLISYVDFGGDQTSSNGDFKITWSASGIVEITCTDAT